MGALPMCVDLRKAARCVYLAADEEVARDLDDRFTKAADLIEQLYIALDEAICLIPTSQKTALANFNAVLANARGEA